MKRASDHHLGRLLMPLLTSYTAHIASAVDPLVMRLTGGRLKVMPVRSLVLHTTGAKTGQPRDSTLGYVAEGRGYVVFATNVGRPYLPGWYHNLHQDPDVAVSVRGRRILVHASEVPDEEWDEVWSRITAWQPLLEIYREQLKGVRRIPIVRLMPRSATERQS